MVEDVRNYTINNNRVCVPSHTRYRRPDVRCGRFFPLLFFLTKRVQQGLIHNCKYRQ